MNIDVIIRKTVVYAVLSGAILVVYLGLVGGLGSFLVYASGMENQTTMIIGSTLVVALLFVPMRNKLQTLVDRNLFRHKYEYPEALRAIAAESADERRRDGVPGLGRGEAAARAAEPGGGDLRGAAGRVRGRGEGRRRGLDRRTPARARTRSSELLDRPFDPRRRTLPDDAAAALARIEAVLVVPIGARGFIAAAPKLSGGEFDVEDIDFLRPAADQLAHGLDRIRMQVEEEDFAQARAIQQALLPRRDAARGGARRQRRLAAGADDGRRLLRPAASSATPSSRSASATSPGKGMPAALLMSGLQAAVRASASSSPRDLCERVRRVVVSSLSGGRFVTFFYATLDTAAMRLRWCNAGHNAPILARADGTVVRLAEGGPAFIAAVPRRAYEEREIALLPGDRLVLFTDGVSEATDADGRDLRRGADRGAGRRQPRPRRARAAADDRRRRHVVQRRRARGRPDAGRRPASR